MIGERQGSLGQQSDSNVAMTPVCLTRQKPNLRVSLRIVLQARACNLDSVPLIGCEDWLNRVIKRRPGPSPCSHSPLARGQRYHRAPRGGCEHARCLNPKPSTEFSLLQRINSAYSLAGSTVGYPTACRGTWNSATSTEQSRPPFGGFVRAHLGLISRIQRESNNRSSVGREW